MSAELSFASPDTDWQAYVERQLRKGIEPIPLRRFLREKGMPEKRIKAVMGPAYEGRSPAAAADHAAIAGCRLVRKADEHPGLYRVPTSKAQVYTWKGFMSPDECARMIAIIDRSLRMSTTTDAFADPEVRTSQSSDIGQMGEPFVHEIEDRMAGGLGIHWSYSDTTQAQRYAVGEEYKAHYDYFTPGTRDFSVFCEERGQRTWTFMVYLNTVEGGGATRFRRLDKAFRPQTGMAVIWNNLTPDGQINPNTLHHGMKVRAGVKYIITKWFRERGIGPMLLA